MKRTISLFLIALLLVACKTKNTTKTNGVSAAFFSYYNTLFNGKQALETELNDRKKSQKDDYYAPYIKLLKYDEQILGEDLAEAFFGDGENQFRGKTMPGQKGAGTLQIAEAKALKAISKYSVMKNGEERNKQMFDAHILLAQARLYQGKNFEALDALNYIFTNMPKDKRVDLAKIYQALAYTKLKDYYRADEVFSSLKNNGMNKKFKKIHSVYYSEMLLEAGKKSEAVEELETAFSVNKNRVLRSRIAFLRGQILAELNRNEEARESFATAYKYANDFEFEVKSQIEIAKTFQNKEDFENAKKYIENISKKGTYASRKNEFLYALGIMAKKAGKPDEALAFFNQSKEMKISDPQIRGLTYYEIGNHYINQKDYVAAGAYYDSALAVMTHQPQKEELAVLSKNIKNISKNYYLVKRNDSILALTKMPDAERIAYFNQHIAQLKLKEEQQAKEEAERMKNERNKGFGSEDYNANSIFSKNANTFQDFSTNSGKNNFYFANQNTVSKGQSEFKQRWGSRSLVDNWRYSSRTTSIEDMKNEALGIDNVKNPRRFEPEYYIEKIPTNKDEILSLKKDRDTASLGLGRMYDNYFSDTKLATQTLYDLVDQKPEEEVKLQALYHIFIMNFEKNPSLAERAKSIILSEFPYTSYAEFVKNPKQSNFSASLPQVQNLYQQAFNLYSEEKFSESSEIISQALQQYPNDALVPKFNLLNAFNTGKTAGKEIMILQLQQIALNYPKTDEGIKANEMLKYLKSDLSVEMTDNSGNSLAKPSNNTEKPSNINKNKRPVQANIFGDAPMVSDEELKAQEEYEKMLEREQELKEKLRRERQKKK